MAEKRDYYEVIGVNKTATADEIKAEYRKKAKKYHPDLNPDNREEAEAKFKELNEAYEVLSDPDKRRKYDQFGHAGVDPSYGAGAGGGFNGAGFQMDLNDLFGSFSAAASAAAPVRRAPIPTRPGAAATYMSASAFPLWRPSMAAPRA